jgi:DNA-binding ferritin-like protein
MITISASLLSGIRNKLKGLFSRIDNFMPGYQASNANIAVKDNIPTYTTTLTAKSSENSNEPITFTVTISCTNVEDTFKDITDVVEKWNSLRNSDEYEQYAIPLKNALTALVGDHDFIPLDKIKSGLLFDNLENGLSSIWADYADNEFKYTIECEAPGKDHGKIGNQSLSSVVKLIPEYLKLVGLTTQVAKIEIDEHKFILPLIIEIQGMLRDWYQSILNEGAISIEEVDDDKNVDEGSEGDVEDTENSEENSTESNSTDVETSNQLQVTLTKVLGSNEIELTAFTSNYDPGQSLSDLDELLSLPEFVETIPQGDPQSYSISTDCDDFTINSIDAIEVDPYTGLTELLKYGIDIYRQLYLLHWMACGNDMMKLHDLCQEFYEELIQEIDTLGELIVEKTGSVINPQEICSDNILEVKKFTYQDGLSILSSLISYYIDLIDYIYINQSSDVQSILDDWLRYWNKQLNYFIKNQEG